MSRKLILFVFAAACLDASAQVFVSKDADISFFSESAIENIEAHNTACKPVMNTATGEILFKIPITSFVFSSSLMQEHFNEDYMESDQYPFATFVGRIAELIEYQKDGCYKATANGKMTIHGVTREVTASGTITVADSQLSVKSVFKIHIADYNVKVPSLYVKNIAEDVEIRVLCTLTPYTKS